MTDQAFTQIIQAHQERQRTIYDELQRLIYEAKEIAAELQRLHGERQAQPDQKAVQRGT